DPTVELFATLRQLRPYLISRAGRWDFHHASVRDAVRRIYLHGPVPDQSDRSRERATRLRLVEYFHPRRYEEHGVEELPWQLAALSDWERLSRLLGDVPFLAAAWETNEFEIRELWGR